MIAILKCGVQFNAFPRKHGSQIGDKTVCAHDQRRVVKVFDPRIDRNFPARAKKVYQDVHVGCFKHAIDQPPFD